MTPSCYRCRQATDTSSEHMFISIPAKLLPEIAESL